MKNINKYILISLFTIWSTSCKHHRIVKNSSIKTIPLTHNIQKKYAIKLSVPESEIENEKLYQFIEEWDGVIYKYAGKDKNGIDCSGLASALYLEVYKKTISSSTKALVNEVKKISQTDLKEGDLVFFNTNGKGISHVGVYLQNNKFVHASTKKGVMISDMNEPYFKNTYVSSGRIK